MTPGIRVVGGAVAPLKIVPMEYLVTPPPKKKRREKTTT